MRIAIDLDTFTPKHLGALIAAMLTCGTATRDAVAHVIAPLGLAHPPTGATKQTIEALKEFPVNVVIRGVSECSPQFTTDELSRLIADLNAELYSRRISADDNPAAGVDAGAVMGGPTSHAGGEPVDLASVFAQADKHVDSVLESRRENNTSGQNGEDAENIKDAFVKEQLGEPFVAGQIPLDKSGLPWDAKIHSASRAINQTDGLWRQKRGVDPDLVATVTAQLRQAMAVPAASGMAIVVDDSISGDGDGPEPSDEAVNEVLAAVGMEIVKPPAAKIPPPPPRRQATQAAAPAEPQPTSAPTTEQGEIDTFPRLLKFITDQKLAGKFNQAHVGQALVAIGIEGPLPVLQNRPDLIPKMVEKLRAIGGV